MRTDPTGNISIDNDIINFKKPYVETDGDLLDRFESLYSQKECYEDEVAEIIIDPLSLEVATEDQFYSHGKVYERSILIYRIEAHYQKHGIDSLGFKDMLTGKK